MKTWKEVLYLLISLSPATGALILYNKLPETMVTHFGLNNIPNGTMSKGITILMLVVLGLIPLLMRVFREIDPKKSNYDKFLTAFEVKRLGITILLAVVGWSIIEINLGYHLNILRIVMIVIGAVLTINGNYLTQVKHNYTFGIRTPWTLANEEVWRKTHRLGGPFLMTGGIIALISAFIDSPLTIVIFLAVIVITALIPLIYSYVIFARIKNMEK
jgi:uncharacterized membrane protein